MLHQLTSEQFHTVQPLFATLSEHHLFCAGVLSGQYDGIVLADDPNQPRSAFVFRPGMWAFLGGDAGNTPFVKALGAALAEKQYIGEKTGALLCMVDSAEWETVLHMLIPNRAPIPTPRHLFIGSREQFNQPPDLPPGYTLHLINDGLHQIATTELPHDVQNVLTLRENKPYPDRHAFGMTILYEGECVTWSMIDVIVGNHGDIGLFTKEAYRRRGLAAVVSGATIQYALANGVDYVHWDVHSGNTASIGLAKKHGLKFESTYNQNMLIFSEVSYLANLAWNQLDDANYDATISYCRQLLDVEGGQMYGNFLLGAALTTTGERETALTHLHRAIDHGMRDRFEWAMCQPLHALHDSAEWEQLMARLPS